MAKRFTDTTKYDRVWFRRLPPRIKTAWDWLYCHCDLVGVCFIDTERMNMEVGEPVSIEELEQHFKITRLGDDRLFLPEFVPFQYGDEAGRLSRKNKLAKKIVRMLEAQGLPLPDFKDEFTSPINTGSIPHTSPSHGVKEEDKDKDKEEVEDKEPARKVVGFPAQGPHPALIQSIAYQRAEEVEEICDLLEQAFDNKVPPTLKSSTQHVRLLIAFKTVPDFTTWLQSMISEPNAQTDKPNWRTWLERQIKFALKDTEATA